MGLALDRVTTALNEYGSSQRGTQWNCPGPSHEKGDEHRSLQVTRNNVGAGLYCHMGCSAEEIVDTIGLRMTDLFDEEAVPVSIEVARYHYVNLDGEVLFTKVRYEPKTFKIGHTNGAGWEWGLGNARRILYNLPEVKHAIALSQTIYVVEGEKDCDRLGREGCTATTNFDGAALPDVKPKWKAEYSDMLAGAKVVIVADRDPAGYAHARAVKESLTGRAMSVKIVQAAVDKPGADVSDHFDAGFTVDQLIPIENDLSKLYKCIDWCAAWEETPEEVNWLIEPIVEAGTVNALFGKPGVGKSLITLEIAMRIVKAGGTVVYLDDENRKRDTIERLKAFGSDPKELANLRLYNFAGLPPLDTAEGGQHLAAIADANEPSLVIIDTTSRMVQGKENDSDTFLQLYRCSLVPLKSRGIAVLRLDHPGKDETRGQRGSSAKLGDIDLLWWLAQDTDTQFTLECQKSRNGHVQQGQMIVIRREFNPLRHVWDCTPTRSGNDVAAIVRQLEKLSVPVSYGRDRTRQMLADNRISCSNEQLTAAIKFRKDQEAVTCPFPPDSLDRSDETPWWDK